MVTERIHGDSDDPDVETSLEDDVLTPEPTQKGLFGKGLFIKETLILRVSLTQPTLVSFAFIK